MSEAVCDTIIAVVFSVQIVFAIGFAISLWRAQHGHGDHLDFFCRCNDNVLYGYNGCNGSV